MRARLPVGVVTTIKPAESQRLRPFAVLRRHALGKFQPLLLAMSRNPAMIVWLDGEI